MNIAASPKSVRLPPFILDIIDPQTDKTVTIFNPRQQIWNEHFAWDDVSAVGLTDIGRATIYALSLNRPTMLAIRTEEKLLNRHPPP